MAEVLLLEGIFPGIFPDFNAIVEQRLGRGNFPWKMSGNSSATVVDLCAALRPVSKAAEWAEWNAGEQAMREGHRWFVTQALEKLSVQ